MKTFTVCRIVWQPVKTEERYISFPLINLLGHVLNIYQMCPHVYSSQFVSHALCQSSESQSQFIPNLTSRV